MHFCHEELYAILAALPFLGGMIAWIRSKFAKKHTCDCPGPSTEQSTRQPVKPAF